MVSVGTIIWLSSELMFFAALFAAYFTIRSVSPELWAENIAVLDAPFASVNTTILVLSSVTCQMGVFAAERGDVFGLRRWYVVTFVMGLFFVLGQGYEYLSLVREGTTIAGSAYGSVFFLTTGFHGLHVIGGLVAFIQDIETVALLAEEAGDAATGRLLRDRHAVFAAWIAHRDDP